MGENGYRTRVHFYDSSSSENVGKECYISERSVRADAMDSFKNMIFWGSFCLLKLRSLFFFFNMLPSLIGLLAYLSDSYN